MADYFHAREPFNIRGKNGLPRTFMPAEVISSDDPDFKGHEKMFEPISESVDRATQSRAGRHGAARAAETASAAPGEKRSRSTTITAPTITEPTPSK